VVGAVIRGKVIALIIYIIKEKIIKNKESKLPTQEIREREN
jgi:hypothetical protein